MKNAALSCGCLLWLATSAAVFAGKVETAKFDLEKGPRADLVLSARGELSLARQPRELADLKAAALWALVPGPKGTWLATTSGPSQLVSIAADGTTKKLWSSETQQAFSVLSLPNSTILLGVGPGGQLLELSTDGKTRELCKLPAEYLWDLQLGTENEILAATGSPGNVYKISLDGKAERWLASGQEHVLRLVPAANGTWLAATGSQGQVLSLAKDGTKAVVYDSGLSEVRGLFRATDGSIFAGTAAAKAGSTAGPERNRFVRIDANGGIRQVLELTGMFYDLAPLGKTSPTLLAGTGPEGKLYALDPEARSARELARLPVEQLVQLVADGSGKVFLGTANPAKVYEVSPDYAASGTWTSEPLDAKFSAQFGALAWAAEMPAGTALKVRARSGNSQTPDETWSAWSAPQLDPRTAAAAVPTARFVQLEATLATTDPQQTPVLRTLSLRYRTRNQAPQITKFEVPNLAEMDGKTKQEKLKLTWTASDPNDDELRSKLTYRKHDWPAAITLVESTKDSEYTWDLTTVPEGRYFLQLIVHDQMSNPSEEALETVEKSPLVVVDNSGPRVQLTADAVQPCTFSVQAEDAYCPLARAAYAVDSGEWQPLFPTDGLLDAPLETFPVRLANLRPGPHVLVVRITDSAGHSSTADMVFEK